MLLCWSKVRVTGEVTTKQKGVNCMSAENFDGADVIASYPASEWSLSWLMLW